MAELEKREELGLGTVGVSSTDVFHSSLVARCVIDPHDICESSSLKVSTVSQEAESRARDVRFKGNFPDRAWPRKQDWIWGSNLMRTSVMQMLAASGWNNWLWDLLGHLKKTYRVRFFPFEVQNCLIKPSLKSGHLLVELQCFVKKWQSPFCWLSGTSGSTGYLWNKIIYSSSDLTIGVGCFLDVKSHLKQLLVLFTWPEGRVWTELWP